MSAASFDWNRGDGFSRNRGGEVNPSAPIRWVGRTWSVNRTTRSQDLTLRPDRGGELIPQASAS